MADSYVDDRPVTARYMDPLDLVWLATAKRLGLTVRRDPDVFAATDGQGLLRLSTREHLDPDDCVAQMVFHEICHWIEAGAEAVKQQDWGFALDWEEDGREYATQRVQAALADRHGLRSFFSSTGSYRGYFDRLGPDPLAPLDDSEDEARVCRMAREALARADQEPWRDALHAALTSTAAFHALVRPYLADYATDDADALPSLWDPSRS